MKISAEEAEPIKSVLKGIAVVFSNNSVEILVEV
jgi:hypothetical protein